jgi:hypothetical protein
MSASRDLADRLRQEVWDALRPYLYGCNLDEPGTGGDGPPPQPLPPLTPETALHRAVNAWFDAVPEWRGYTNVLREDRLAWDQLLSASKDRALPDERKYEALMRFVTWLGSQAEPPPRPDLPTLWYHGERSYSTDGETPRCVTREEHNLLTQFLDCHLSFETKTLQDAGVSNPSRVVASLIGIFGPEPFQKPKEKYAGYFIRVRSHPRGIAKRRGDAK